MKDYYTNSYQTCMLYVPYATFSQKVPHVFPAELLHTSSYSAYFLYNAYSDDYDNDNNNNILTDA